jgi:retron-type reverse transcriptase
MGLFDFLKRMLSGQPKRPPQSQRQSSGNTTPTQAVNVFTSNSVGSVQTRLSPAPSPPTPPKPRADKKLALDASQFAPISSSNAVAAARSSETLLNNPWWGRLDTIPPASDERTLLIDRTLVAYGLFSPEDLVEIHKIGDQMLEIKGDRALADIEARAAVAASDAERQRIKAEKKAAAAERKRLHAEGVKHRKATDVIFLGRGVSRGLADRRANVEKLQAAELPVLATPADVARAMGLSISRLRWLAFHSDASEVSHYVRFTVPKKSGGVRELAAPHRDLAAAQQWIFENVLQPLPTHPAAHGFVKGRSICTNAAPHVGQCALVNLDLENFFPAITFHRVRGALQQLGYSPAVATIFALLATESPRLEVEYAGRRFHVATGPRALPQGACTSPALSNLISRRLDARLSGIAAKLGWRYTRYADDMSFSADAAASLQEKTGYLLARIRHIVQEEGFTVNEAKTRVLKTSASMHVTGLVVNERIGVRRREVRKLRAILHNAAKHGLASQNRDDHPHFESQLRGRIAFVEMVNPGQARDLVEAFQNLTRI